MKRLLVFTLSLILFSFILPFKINAANTCSNTGYTIFTINGINCDEKGARENRTVLEAAFKLKISSTSEPIYFDYLYNATHLGGAGDLLKSVEQGIFDSAKLKDYDLVEMLLSASQKLDTRKVLLVAHSQGNFYANSFYGAVVNKEGGAPKESFGIYSVATPSSFVAGDGKYITSDTDKVIAAVRGVNFLNRSLPPNVHIEIQPNDDNLGHSFANIYLKYQSSRIISEIQSSLANLKASENISGPCLVTPDISQLHKIEGAVLTAGDSVSNFIIKAIKNGINIGEIIVNDIKNMAISIGNNVKDFFSSIFHKKDEFKLAQVVDLDRDQQNQNEEENNGNNVFSESPETVLNENENQPSASSTIEEPIKEETKKPELKFCSFNASQMPTHNGLIINEVAWMGTTISANDEWIELKNISDKNIDVTNWQIIDKGEQIKINLSSIKGSKIIKPGQFILLERTNDSSVPSVPADLIYTGGLSNSKEGLRLFDSHCNLVDEAFANPNWPAGDNTSKRTMERKSDLSWQTSVFIGGTPKANNSAGYVPTNNQNATSSKSSGSSKASPRFYPVVINEIMYNPLGSDEGREWIEIFNSGDSLVDLTNWKFYENQTNHTLTAIQGSMILAAGDYAVIVNSSDKNKFLIDYPNYNGTLLKSSFSLNNSGESIAIKNGDLLIDEVSYSSSLGADGDGNSLQKINNKWLAGLPTPGRANQIMAFGGQGGSSDLPSTENTISTSTEIKGDIQETSHVVISEIMVGGGTGRSYDEFIELYNPTNSTTSLSGYSIQYLSGVATSTDKIRDNHTMSNFENNAQISPYGFFLLVNRAATSTLSSKADMIYSSSTFSLSGISTGASIFLVNATTSISDINDPRIIDSLSYGNPSLSVWNATSIVPGANKSLERKSWQNGYCLLAQGNGEFLGNGCDTDSVTDFDLRDVPTPQNSKNLPEPRNAPTTIKDFNITFSSTTMSLNLSWSSSTDALNSSEGIIYQILDISSSTDTSFTPFIFAPATSTQRNITIQEIGRSYKFSIQPFDKDELGGEITEKEIQVPSFLSHLYFYNGKYDDSTSTLAEFYFDSYPFIPTVSWDLAQYGYGVASFKAMVIYFNKDLNQANVTRDFWTSAPPSNWPGVNHPDLTNLVQLKYITLSSNSLNPHEMVLLYDNIKKD